MLELGDVEVDQLDRKIVVEGTHPAGQPLRERESMAVMNGLLFLGEVIEVRVIRFRTKQDRKSACRRD